MAKLIDEDRRIVAVESKDGKYVTRAYDAKIYDDGTAIAKDLKGGAGQRILRAGEYMNYLEWRKMVGDLTQKAVKMSIERTQQKMKQERKIAVK